MPHSRPAPRRRHDRGLIYNAFALLMCGLLAGIVVAAAVFPAVAVPGLVAKVGVDQFGSLPSVLNMPQLPQASGIYAADGKTLVATFYDENRKLVTLDAIAPVMREALVAAEDMRYYEHHGVDVKSIARAWVINQQAGQTTQGASTLTMQYVRMVLEYSATTPQQSVDAAVDNTERKVREMHYALAVEKVLSKDQIMERYLNVAPFGNGAYGIYAAAEVYFGKAPKNLTLGEGSLLAGIIKAPTAFDPLTDSGLARATDRRDNHVLSNMVKMGYITEAERQQAMMTPLKLVGKATRNGCVQATNNSWGFFCDYFYRWWLGQPAFGADQYEREQRLKTGGYTIVTSLDVQAQAAAKRNVEKYDRTGNPTALMLVGVQPGTGRVNLMATNRNYSNDQGHNHPSTNPEKRGQRGSVPNTTNPLLTGGGDINGYQFGSTFKVFTLVAALEKGYELDYGITTTSPYVSKYRIEPGSPAACNGDHYCPVNANPSWMNGRRDMWTGLGRSVNTYWVPMEEIVGAQNAVDAARRLGVQFRSSSDARYAANANQWGAFTLGVSAATPLDMANAYATLAADGKYCEPTPVIDIRDLSGRSLDMAKPRCRRAVSADVARAAIDAMRCPVGDQSAYHRCNGATAANVRDIVGKPLAGKTGTTDSNQTAALILTTCQQAVAGIVADPDWAQTSRLRFDLGGRDPHSRVVNPAVAYTMHDVMVDKPAQGFAAPPRSLAFGGRGVPASPSPSASPGSTKMPPGTPPSQPPVKQTQPPVLPSPLGLVAPAA
jgi:membrane peptidoglycan carboxypeptidase